MAVPIFVKRRNAVVPTVSRSAKTSAMIWVSVTTAPKTS
jgi:hypothetical protein